MPSDVICHVTTKVLVAAKKGINKQGNACRQQGAGDEISSGRNGEMGGGFSGLGRRNARDALWIRKSLDMMSPCVGKAGRTFFLFLKVCKIYRCLKGHWLVVASSWEM